MPRNVWNGVANDNAEADKGQVGVATPLRHKWNVPHDMPSDSLPTVLHFRIHGNTFAQIKRETREEKKTATLDK